MKKITTLLIATLCLFMMSCNKMHDKGGNLPLKFNTTLEDFHKWNHPANLLTNQSEKEKGVEQVAHSIEFDGSNFILDKGTDSEIVYEVNDYTYQQTDISNGQGTQEQYIITATNKRDGHPTHNISIVKASGNYQKMVFVTLPLVDKRNELSGVAVFYGLL